MRSLDEEMSTIASCVIRDSRAILDMCGQHAGCCDWSRPETFERHRYVSNPRGHFEISQQPNLDCLMVNTIGHSRVLALDF